MRAVRIKDNQVFLDERAPEPTPSKGDAIVRTTRVLLRRADLANCAGAFGFSGIVGHQFLGVVESVGGSENHPLIGKRVVGNPNIADPSSEQARRGLAKHDPDRAVLGLAKHDGCLAERFSIPVVNLAPVPETILDDHAIFANTLASSVHAGQMVRIEGKPYVTVLGEDIAALLCAQVMTRMNASVRLLTTRTDRLELCAKWGIKHRHLDEVGRRADQDVVVDTTQDPRSLQIAMRMVRPRGTIVLSADPLSIPSKDHGAIDWSPIVSSELSVLGARCGSVGEGLATMASGRIDLSGLITKRFRLEDAINAIKSAGEPDQIGVVVDVARS
ncbi:MAG: alcohol dehydrogenase catalytic domain-containing protein [Phycisphaerales bacterium]|nr:alcohol dehydrogenase catalytic domain-containing protein [Phycisphaerales bacterium]